MSSRRAFLKFIGATVATSAFLPMLGCAKQGKRPNVILILTDDQGYGDIGCNGNRWVKTPNVDMFSKKSILLTDFHVGPTCAPTRAGLMTGRYCNRTGVWHTIMGRSLLRKDETTMADLFKASGYKTGIFGKWHLGDNYPFRPQDRGFDEVMIHGGGGVGQTPDYWGNDYFDDFYLHNGERIKYNGYCTDIWFDGVKKFIKENKDKPFFCYVSTNAPHGPLNVAEKYSKPYEEMGVPASRARFYGMIENIDENVGELVRKMQEWDLLEDTIFIYMTDNGSATGSSLDKDGFVESGFNAGMRGKKGSEYEGGHRVAFFIAYPNGKIGGGKKIDQLTAHVDVMPTLVELCGLEQVGKNKLDGTSLVPLLTGKGDFPEERILVTDSQRIEYPEKWRKSAVMKQKWRLINGKELYDIKSDPEQRNDIAEQHPDLVEKLRQAYDEWWASMKDSFDVDPLIQIGSDHENPATITGHDWHGKSAPWNHSLIRKGLKINGYWLIDVVNSGTYEFILRRWPKELDKALQEGIPAIRNVPGVNDLPEGVELDIKSAKIQIGQVQASKFVQNGDKQVRFELKLSKGKNKMQTWFTDSNGESWGAYYVYARLLK